jgi:hypothetical protein
MIISSSSSGSAIIFKLTIHDKISIVGYDRSILFNPITKTGDTAEAPQLVHDRVDGKRDHFNGNES